MKSLFFANIFGLFDDFPKWLKALQCFGKLAKYLGNCQKFIKFWLVLKPLNKISDTQYANPSL